MASHIATSSKNRVQVLEEEDIQSLLFDIRKATSSTLHPGDDTHQHAPPMSKHPHFSSISSSYKHHKPSGNSFFSYESASTEAFSEQTTIPATAWEQKLLRSTQPVRSRVRNSFNSVTNPMTPMTNDIEARRLHISDLQDHVVDNVPIPPDTAELCYRMEECLREFEHQESHPKFSIIGSESKCVTQVLGRGKEDNDDYLAEKVSTKFRVFVYSRNWQLKFQVLGYWQQYTEMRKCTRQHLRAWLNAVRRCKYTSQITQSLTSRINLRIKTATFQHLLEFALTKYHVRHSVLPAWKRLVRMQKHRADMFFSKVVQVHVLHSVWKQWSATVVHRQRLLQRADMYYEKQLARNTFTTLKKFTLLQLRGKAVVGVLVRQIQKRTFQSWKDFTNLQRGADMFRYKSLYHAVQRWHVHMRRKRVLKQGNQLRTKKWWKQWNSFVNKRIKLQSIHRQVEQNKLRRLLSKWNATSQVNRDVRKFTQKMILNSKARSLKLWRQHVSLRKSLATMLCHSSLKVKADKFHTWKHVTHNAIQVRQQQIRDKYRCLSAWHREVHIILPRYNKLRYRKHFKSWTQLITHKRMKVAALHMAGIHSRMALLCRSFGNWRSYINHCTRKRGILQITKQHRDHVLLRQGLEGLLHNRELSHKLSITRSHFVGRSIRQWYSVHRSRLHYRQQYMTAIQYRIDSQRRKGLQLLLNSTKASQRISRAAQQVVVKRQRKLFQKWKRQQRLRQVARQVSIQSKRKLALGVMYTWKSRYSSIRSVKVSETVADTFFQYHHTARFIMAWYNVTKRRKHVRQVVNQHLFQRYILKSCVNHVRHWLQWMLDRKAIRSKLETWRKQREQHHSKQNYTVGTLAKHFLYWSNQRHRIRVEQAETLGNNAKLRRTFVAWKHITTTMMKLRKCLLNWHYVSQKQAELFPGLARARIVVQNRSNQWLLVRMLQKWKQRYQGRVLQLMQVQQTKKLVCRQLLHKHKLVQARNCRVQSESFKSWKDLCVTKNVQAVQLHHHHLLRWCLRYWNSNARELLGRRMLVRLGIVDHPEINLANDMNMNCDIPFLDSIAFKQSSEFKSVEQLLRHLFSLEDTASILRVLFHCYERPNTKGWDFETFCYFCRDFGFLNEDTPASLRSMVNAIQEAQTLDLEHTHFGKLSRHQLGFFNHRLEKRVGFLFPQGIALPPEILRHENHSNSKPAFHVSWTTFIRYLLRQSIIVAFGLVTATHRMIASACYTFRTYVEKRLLDRVQVWIESNRTSFDRICFTALEAPAHLFHPQVRGLLQRYEKELRSTFKPFMSDCSQQQKLNVSKPSGCEPVENHKLLKGVKQQSGMHNRTSKTLIKLLPGEVILFGTEFKIVPDLCSFDEFTNLVNALAAVYQGELEYPALEELLVQVAIRFVPLPSFNNFAQETLVARVGSGLTLSVKLRVLLMMFDSNNRVFKENAVALRRLGVARVVPKQHHIKHQRHSQQHENTRTQFRRHSVSGTGCRKEIVPHFVQSGSTMRRSTHGKHAETRIPSTKPSTSSKSTPKAINQNIARHTSRRSPFSEPGYAEKFYKRNRRRRSVTFTDGTGKSLQVLRTESEAFESDSSCLVSPSRQAWGRWGTLCGKEGNQQHISTKHCLDTSLLSEDTHVTTRRSGTVKAKLDVAGPKYQSLQLLHNEAKALSEIHIQHPVLEQMTGPSASNAASVLFESGAMRSQPDTTNLDLATGTDFQLGVRFTPRQLMRNPGPLLDHNHEFAAVSAKYPGQDDAVFKTQTNTSEVKLSEQLDNIINRTS